MLYFEPYARLIPSADGFDKVDLWLRYYSPLVAITPYARVAGRAVEKLDNMTRIIPPACVVIGIACLCVAIGSLILTNRFLAAAVSTGGVVVDIVQSQDHEGNRTFAPKVRYHVNEREHEFISPLTSGWPAYRKGQEVTVVYARAAPDKGRLDVWWGHYYVVVVSGFFGVVFTAMGIGWVVAARRP